MVLLKVIPVHFQTKLSVEIVFSCPNEFELSYGCSKTLQLSKDETCNTPRSRNATYYSAKFAYSQSQYTISSITQKYGADQTVTRNLLVAIISLRLCAINVSQTSLLLMETLSAGMAMEFVRCSLCCKAKYGSSQEMKTISPPLCSPWPAKIFQYFRRFVPNIELMFESF